MSRTLLGFACHFRLRSQGLGSVRVISGTGTVVPVRWYDGYRFDQFVPKLLLHNGPCFIKRHPRKIEPVFVVNSVAVQ